MKSPEASSWKPVQHPGTAMKSSNSYLTCIARVDVGIADGRVRDIVGVGGEHNHNGTTKKKR